MNLLEFLNVILVCSFVSYSQQLRFGAFRGVPYIFNYSDGQDWCYPSFECDIIDYLCQGLGAGDCSLTIFDSLEDRLTSLENDEVDIVVSRFHVSPDSAQRVNFVRPYYYSAGAQLFSLPGDKQLFSAHDDLISQPVCMDLGYYAASTLKDEYGMFLFPSTKVTVLEQIKTGNCIATITDSDFVLDGLVQSDLPPLYILPYAVAISKTPSIENLETDIQNVLLEMMVKGQDNLSMLEQLSEKYILPQGIKNNTKLSQISRAITYNDGEYIGNEVEDFIWNAANMTVDRRLSEELMKIDPEYDIACRKGLEAILESYTNGTKVGDLPMIVIDSISYTFVVGFNDDNDMISTFVMLQHPFIPRGKTGQQLAENNPQFLVILANIQDVYLQDEQNQVQGAKFYITYPFDGTQGIAGSQVRVSLTSPTRVVKTSLFIIIQEQTEDNEQLVMAGCGVGEIRNW